MSEPKVTWPGFLARVAELAVESWGNTFRICFAAGVLAALLVLVRIMGP